MRFLLQRVKEAKVEVDNEICGEIDKGYLVFIGITHGDTKEMADKLIKKMCNLRIFCDQNDKMNLSIKDVKGKLLLVSQFTLYANCKNGNRPSFTDAANPHDANILYEYICDKCTEEGIDVQKGIFGEDMKVSLINDGPVTILLENRGE